MRFMFVLLGAAMSDLSRAAAHTAANHGSPGQQKGWAIAGAPVSLASVH